MGPPQCALQKELQPHLAPCLSSLTSVRSNRQEGKMSWSSDIYQRLLAPFLHLFLVLPFADFEQQ
jgi:hypothetical protein